MDFLCTMCVALKLPEVAMFTACRYYHRVQRHISKRKQHRNQLDKHDPWLQMDDTLLITTCIYLATKTCDEAGRKLRDVVQVAYVAAHPNEPFLPMLDLYWKLRESVVTLELLLVRLLGNDTDALVPDTRTLMMAYLYDFFTRILPLSDDSLELYDKVLVKARQLLYQAHFSSICVRYEACELAHTIVYMAVCDQVPNALDLKSWCQLYNSGDGKYFSYRIAQELIRELS